MERKGRIASPMFSVDPHEKFMKPSKFFDGKVRQKKLSFLLGDLVMEEKASQALWHEIGCRF